jgi:methionyl-tRNA formyltransferase
MLTDVGFVAANTSRTRAYLAALERHDLLPTSTVLLDDELPAVMPGQADSTVEWSLSQDRQVQSWSEVDFDPNAPLEPWLQRLGLDYVVAGSRDINSAAVVDLIARSEPSVFIYSGYGGALLRREVLETGKRFLHVHGGYLPDFKGSTTNYYSLLAEGILGASALFLTAEIDSGPVLARRRFPPPDERTEIDHIHDSAARARVLVDTLSAYREQEEWRFELPDNRGGTTYYIIHPVLKHLAILGNAAASDHY